MGSGSHSRTQYQQLSPLVSLSLFLWLYKDSGSRNTIYASFASCIVWVLAPIHAHNINQPSCLSLSLPIFIRIPAHGTLYISFASCIVWVLAPIHAHNINSLALLSLSLSSYGFIRIPAHGTLYMPALLVALCGFWLPFTRTISTA